MAMNPLDQQPDATQPVTPAKLPGAAPGLLGAPMTDPMAFAPGGAGGVSNVPALPMSPLTPGNQATDVGGYIPPAAPQAAPVPSASYNLSPVTADSNLLNQQITPNQNVDRYKQAQDAIDNYRKTSQPGFEANIRDIAAQSFGAGRGVSGQNRTRLGNLEAARESDLAGQGFNFLNNALTGSIEDKYRDIGIGQQERGFQAGQQQTAFDQAKEQALLEDQLTNSDFGRNLARETAGYADSPISTDQYLSGQFGNQASAAGQAAASALGSAGRGGQSGLTADDIMRILDQYKSAGSAGTPPYVDDTGGQGVYG